MIALPDVNVLIDLVWSNHPQHDAAHEWFGRDASTGWATCLFTQTAFLRLSLNPQIVRVAIDCPTALQLLDGIASHPNHKFLELAPALAATTFGELAARIVDYGQVSDATLLHIARHHNARLVTFDHALASICPWPECLLVLPAQSSDATP